MKVRPLFKTMKVFFIKGKQYVSTSSKGNYSKVVDQIIKDCGGGFVYFKASHRLKIGFSEFNDLHLSFPRSLAVPYRQIFKLYMLAEDVKRLLGFGDQELEPQEDGTYEFFTDVIQINGLPERYYSIKDVEELYWNLISNTVKSHGFGSHYEFPGKISIEVNSKKLEVKVEYK